MASRTATTPQSTTPKREGRRSLPSEPSSAPALGTELADWQLLRVLGRGACSVVVEARLNTSALDTVAAANPLDPTTSDRGAVGENQHTTLTAAAGDGSTTFALKIQSKADALQRRRLHRVRAEREVLELQHNERHPFIVPVFALFQSRGLLCAVLGLARRGTLHALLAKLPGRRLPDEQTSRGVLAEVLSAVEYLHAHGIVTRDLKSEQLLVADSGHVFLTDFDLCLTPAGRARHKSQRAPSPAAPSPLVFETDVAGLSASASRGASEISRTRGNSGASAAWSAPNSLAAAHAGGALLNNSSLGSSSGVYFPSATGAAAFAASSLTGTPVRGGSAFAASTATTAAPTGGTPVRGGSGAAAYIVGAASGRHALPPPPLPPDFGGGTPPAIDGSTASSALGVTGPSVIELGPLPFASQPALPQSAHARRTSFVGSAECLSPEVIADEEPTAACDVWGLGILLYEMTFGVGPFSAAAAGATTPPTVAAADRDAIRRIETHDTIPMPSSPPVSKELRALLRALLSKDPSQRPTIEQIRRDKWFAGSGIDFRTLPASADGPLKPVLPLVDRHDASAGSNGSSSGSRAGHVRSASTASTASSTASSASTAAEEISAWVAAAEAQAPSPLQGAAFSFYETLPPAPLPKKRSDAAIAQILASEGVSSAAARPAGATSTASGGGWWWSRVDWTCGLRNIGRGLASVASAAAAKPAAAATSAGSSGCEMTKSTAVHMPTPAAGSGATAPPQQQQLAAGGGAETTSRLRRGAVDEAEVPLASGLGLAASPLGSATGSGANAEYMRCDIGSSTSGLNRPQSADLGRRAVKSVSPPPSSSSKNSGRRGSAEEAQQSSNLTKRSIAPAVVRSRTHQPLPTSRYHANRGGSAATAASGGSASDDDHE